MTITSKYVDKEARLFNHNIILAAKLSTEQVTSRVIVLPMEVWSLKGVWLIE